MSDNERIIRDFIATWPSLDVDKIVDFFTEDGIYYNMPIAPVAGRDQLRGFIATFLKDWTKTNWDILNIAAVGNVVIAERVDHIHVGDKQVDLPCCGVFELENGKIKVWRDYFDLATYSRALT
ncbi:limonene-1,2-epoxide hydrolase family protein [Vitreimonas flagellata]|uniref:limonene-1,2-epoxide hydrolase family protein n=1 Tax=Vitreimonas flagellata TaxID=2560861 RepID=UPI001074A87B|nr:limonene-1,2-epoxide hydrolase family protein [Vitreimonas flagellata]